MKMMKGFTLIELLIVIAIIAIIAAIAIPQISGYKKTGSSISYSPIFGGIETRCIEGYKFVITKDGARQVLSEWGRGVACSGK